MADVGFRNSSVADLDGLAEPIASNPTKPTTGFRKADGTDLGSVYLSQADVLSTARTSITTGFKNSSGVDIGAVFQKKHGFALRATGPAGGLIFYDQGSYSDGYRYIESWTTDEGYKTWAQATAGGWNHGGYTDWFLPSITMLQYMYNNLKAYSVGNFALEFYWSSTYPNSTQAYAGTFDGWASDLREKTESHKVRVVRYC